MGNYPFCNESDVLQERRKNFMLSRARERAERADVKKATKEVRKRMMDDALEKAKAFAEKGKRDLLAAKEQTERNL
nr:hypothetical protein [Tanacetum cinerariifolium]